ncbi:MAG: 4Fe-4S dicluster domain-containing protein [Candidatus Aminicenantaceae bacterium]
MNFWFFAGEFAFIALFLFFFFFFVSSFREKEKKAFRRSLYFLLFLMIFNAVILLLKDILRSWFFGGIFIFLVAGVFLVLFFPLLKKPIQIIGEQKKIDERDTIFARFDYREGTEIFEEYYKKNPEFKEIDEEIRKLPDLHTPPHLKKDPLLLSLAVSEFDFLRHQVTKVDGEICAEKIDLSSQANTYFIKKAVNYLGSELCGISLLDQAYVYSHVGRGPEPYGKRIELDHKYAIVFALEMDFKMITSAPSAPVIVETGKQYIEAARISIILSNLIRHLGYSARAHVAGSNYQAILPPLGWLAGLGELGRLGILVTWKYGPRARLGLVTTDLLLVPDEPRVFGVQNFCEKCHKCATNCPAQAIPLGRKKEENGVLKRALKKEECYRYWRKAGTDCAICIFVCPYSKPDNYFHNFIRRLTTRSSISQSFSVWADDFFYGRFPERRKRSLLGI